MDNYDQRSAPQPLLVKFARPRRAADVRTATTRPRVSMSPLRTAFRWSTPPADD
jgi:hypothetical protein